MAFLKKLFSRPPQAGKWVRNKDYINRVGLVDLDTYHWEGPLPEIGQNPGETPEALAKRKANNNKRKANNEAAMLRMNARIKQAAKNAEEKAEEDKACQNAINAVRAKRSNATKRNRRGSRKTRKN